LRFEAQVANSELLKERANNLAALLEENLRVLMHDPSVESYAIGEDIRKDPPVVARMPATLQEGYNEAVHQRLELKALEETVYSLRNQAQVARSAIYPRLEASGDLTYANPNQRFVPQTPQFRTTWSVGLQLSWSPNDVPLNLASERSTLAKASQTELQKASLRDGLRSEVMQALQNTKESFLALETTMRSLGASEESYRVRRELFKNGRATNVEVLDAETTLLQARLENINARINFRIAAVQLDHALGRDALLKERSIALTPTRSIHL
jgi:outer membrane protein